MIDRPSEKEQIRIITRNLSKDFAKHLVVFQASADFKAFYEAGLAIEEAIQNGIFEKGDSNPKVEKIYSEDNDTKYTDTPSKITINNTSKAKPAKISTQTNWPKDQPRTFSKFSAPLSSVYKELFKDGLLEPLQPKPLPKKLPSSHDPDAFCAFHQVPGHATDKCQRLRHEIQNLIDNGTLPTPPMEPDTMP
jgi:hypothetical protein